MAILQHPLPGFPTPTNGGFGAPRGIIGGVDYGRHKGHDWSAPTGTPVRAAGVGVVSHVGGLACPYHIGAGHHVIVDHGNGIETRYVHLSAKYVRAGAGVLAGQAIGAVGSTGTATGPHLHFEVVVNGIHVDPLPYLGLAPANQSSGVTRAEERQVYTKLPHENCKAGYHPALLNNTSCVPDEMWNPFETLPDAGDVIPTLFELALPPLLEPAMSIAILGGSGLLIWVGIQRLVAEAGR